MWGEGVAPAPDSNVPVKNWSRYVNWVPCPGWKILLGDTEGIIVSVGVLGPAHRMTQSALSPYHKDQLFIA